MRSNRNPSGNSREPAAQAKLFADRLFGKNRRGTVCAAYGISGQRTPTGGYTFGGRLRHKYFEWPRERERLLSWAEGSCDKHDLYLIPNLRSARSAKVGFGEGGRYVWADIDHVTDETWRRLDAVLNRGSLVVYSGGRDGLHVYLRLDGWYPPRIFEELNEQFDGYIGGDHKHRENTLLRLPGTWNHKGRAKGVDSYSVRLSDDEYEISPWSPAALSEAFGRVPPLTQPKSKPKIANAKKGRTPQGPRREAQQIVPVDAEPLPEELPDEIRRLVHFNTKKTAKTDRTRSGQLDGLVAVAMSYGYNDGAIMGIAQLSEPGHEKWPNPTDLKREIQRCINNRRPGHPHVGLTCHEARCQTASSRVSDEIVAIRSHFRSEHRPGRTLPADTKILDAFLQRAQLIGDLKLDMSQRQLSELAGVSRVTAGNGLKRLIKAGYVKHVVKSNGQPVRAGQGPLSHRAFRYELKCPTVVPLPHNHIKNVFLFSEANEANEANDLTSTLNPNHDVWRYGGLMAEKNTYESLLRRLTTIKEIADYQGRSSRTVTKHLHTLAFYSLARQCVDGKSWAPLERPLDEVAKELGTYGMGERQAKQHARESDGFRAYLETREEEDRQMFKAREARGHVWDGYKLVPPNRSSAKRRPKQGGRRNGK